MIKSRNHTRQVIRPFDLIQISLSNNTDEEQKNFLYSVGFYPKTIKLKYKRLKQNIYRTINKQNQLIFENTLFQVIPVQKSLQEGITLEELQNKVSYETPIPYASEVVLRHHYSSKFVSVQKEIEESGNYTILLVNQLQPNCVFKVIPRYKSQVQEEWSITYDGDLMLSSVYLEPTEQRKQGTEKPEDMFNLMNKFMYVTIKNSDDAMKYLNQKQQQNLKNSTIDEVDEDQLDVPQVSTENNIQQSRHEIQVQDYSNYSSFQSDLSIQPETGSCFRFHLVRPGNMQQQPQLQCSQLVRLNHLQTTSCLEPFYERFIPMEDNQANLNIADEYEQLVNKTQIVFHFHVKSDKQTEFMHLMEKNLNLFRVKQAIWRVFRVEQPWKNSIISKDTIYLEYLQKSKFLAFSLENGVYLEKIPSEQCEFQIIHASEQNQNYKTPIAKNSLFYLTHKKTGLFLSLDTQTTVDNDSQEQLIDPNVALRKPKMISTLNQGDCFRFRYLPQEVVTSLNFLNSSYTLLKFGVSFFKEQTLRLQDRISLKNPEIQQERLISSYFHEVRHQICLCLLELTRFCLEIPQTADINSETIKMFPPNSHHQRLLREREIPQIIQKLMDSLLPSRTIIKYVRNQFKEDQKESQMGLLDLDIRYTQKSYRRSSIQQVRVSLLNQRKEAKQDPREQARREQKEMLRNYRELMRIMFLFIEAFCKQNQDNSMIGLILYYHFEKYVGYGLGAGNCLIRMMETNPNLRSLINSASFQAKIKLEGFKQDQRRQTQQDKIEGQMKQSSKRKSSFLISLQNKQNKQDVVFDPLNQQGRNTLIDLMFQRYEELYQDQIQNYWINFLKFLNTLCVCGVQISSHNQIGVGLRFFNDGYYQKLLIPLISQGDVIHAQIKEPNPHDIELLQLYSSGTTASQELLDFLDQELDLLAQLCVGRNYFNIDHIRQFINSPVLAKYIKDNNDINENLRARLVSIALALYIDTEPNRAVAYPQYIKVIEQQNKLIKEKEKQQIKTKNSQIFDETNQFTEIELQESQNSSRKLIQSSENQLHELSFSNIVDTNGDQTYALKQFILKCLKEKIINNQYGIELSQFNAKILQLFEKLYSFKLISEQDFNIGSKENKPLFFYELIQIQQRLPEQVQINLRNSDGFTKGLMAYEVNENNRTLDCYKMISRYLYGIYTRFTQQELNQYTDEVILSLKNVNETNISQMIDVLQQSLPSLRFTQQDTLIPDISQMNKNVKFLECTIQNFLIPVNDYETDKRIFDFLMIYMQPRRQIIKNLRHTLVLTDFTEKKVNKFLKKTTISLETESEKSKKNLTTILQTLHDIFILMHQGSYILNQKPFMKSQGKISFLRQNLIRHLDTYKGVLKILFNKTNKMNQIDYNLQLFVQQMVPYQQSQEDRQVVEIVQLCFKILLGFISNKNQKNKKLIFEQHNILAPYLVMFNYGQYELLSELYENEPEICMHVPFTTLQALTRNPSYYSLDVLDKFISAGGFVISRNVNILTKLIFTKNNIYKFLGITTVDISKKSQKLQTNIQLEFNIKLLNLPTEILQMSGQLPFLYQSRALSLIRKIYSLTSQQKLFQSLFIQFVNPLFLFKIIAEDQDVFQPIQKSKGEFDQKQKACMQILKTFLKIQVIGVLKEIILIQDNIMSNPFIVSQIGKFLKNEETRMTFITNENQSKYLKTLQQTLKDEYTLKEPEEVLNDNLSQHLNDKVSPLVLSSWVLQLIELIASNEQNEALDRKNKKNNEGDFTNDLNKYKISEFTKFRQSQTFSEENKETGERKYTRNKQNLHDNIPEELDNYIHLVIIAFNDRRNYRIRNEVPIESEYQSSEPKLPKLEFNVFYIEHILGLILIVFRQLNEQMENQEDQPNRTQSSTLIRQSKKSEFKRQNSSETIMAISRTNQSEALAEEQRKLKQLEQVVEQMTNYSLSVEGYFTIAITTEEYAENEKLLIQFAQEYRIQFQNEINFECKNNQNFIKTYHEIKSKQQQNKLNINQSSIQHFDTRLQDLVDIKEQQSAKSIYQNLISLQCSGRVRQELLIQERVHMFNQFWLLMDDSSKYYPLIEKVFLILKNGLYRIVSRENNSQSMREEARSINQAIEFLQHAIDFEGDDLSNGVESTLYFKKDNISQDENVQIRIRQVKMQRMKKELQIFIGELGYFGVFINFMGSVNAEYLDGIRILLPQEANDEIENEIYEEEDEGENLIMLKKRIYSRFFNALLLLSIRLIRGKLGVNTKNQDKFYQEVKSSRSDVFCKRVVQLINREIDEFLYQQNDVKLALRKGIKKISLSYNFQEDNILQNIPCASLNSLHYQLKRKQYKIAIQQLKQMRHIRNEQKKKKQKKKPNLKSSEFLLVEDTSYHLVKFIQLLVEDHHSNLQDYLRDQNIQSNYDVVRKIVDLFKTYILESFHFQLGAVPNFKDIQLSYDINLKILNTIDTLKELLQGCRANQVLVCQPKFFELISNILNLDDSHQVFRDVYSDLIHEYNMQQKLPNPLWVIDSMIATISGGKKDQSVQQSDIQLINGTKLAWTKSFFGILLYYRNHPAYAKALSTSYLSLNPANTKVAMLSQLKYKSLTILESLLDGDDGESLQSMSTYIPEQIINKNLGLIYEKFKILYRSGKNYQSDLFNHFNNKPPVPNSDDTLGRYIQLTLRRAQQESEVAEDIFCVIGFVLELRNPSSAYLDLWKSFMIETGFTLFNLLSRFYILRSNDAILRIQEQINKEKIQKELYNNKIIIFQVLYFIGDIFKTSGQMVDQLNSSRDMHRAFEQFQLNGKSKKLNQEMLQKQLGFRALRFFTKRTGTIEVNVNSQLTKVLFPLMPYCFSLTNVIKRDFQDAIDRFSAQTKVQSVLSISEEVIQKLKYEQEFEQFYARHPIINLLASNISLWKQLSFVFIILENIAVLENNYSNESHLILIILNALQLSLTCLTFSFYLIKIAPYLQRKASQEILDKRIERARTIEVQENFTESTQKLQKGNENDLYLQMEEEIHQKRSWKQKFIIRFQEFWIRVRCLLFDSEVIHYLIFIMISTFGFWKPILLSGLLVDVFWRFPTLSYIVDSIWRPKIQILLTLGLFGIIQYYYTLIVYFFFSSSYDPECSDLMSCFSFLIDVTFKIDGGFVGYYLAKMQNTGDIYYGPGYKLNWLSLVDFSYILIVVEIVGSIITGIIIDTFGVLRDEASSIKDDIEGYCLICGFDRGTIDKKCRHRKGFPFHVKYEHNQWNYIYYISYLLDKNQSEYLGLETYVINKIQNQEINWFPLNQALSIPDEQDQTEQLQELKQSVEKSLEVLEKKINIVLNKLQNNEKD